MSTPFGACGPSLSTAGRASFWGRDPMCLWVYCVSAWCGGETGGDGGAFGTDGGAFVLSLLGTARLGTEERLFPRRGAGMRAYCRRVVLLDFLLSGSVRRAGGLRAAVDAHALRAHARLPPALSVYPRTRRRLGEWAEVCGVWCAPMGDVSVSEDRRHAGKRGGAGRRWYACCCCRRRGGCPPSPCSLPSFFVTRWAGVWRPASLASSLLRARRLGGVMRLLRFLSSFPSTKR
ncbi:hypothetical protein C8F04DRAFT_1088014 [Mycena alexandri]|uniref:Uncharacterized protein n=1 Tax=Mycena alexandri TaxID=1745969 RepID=A0AAD6T442_9AGAR|nr:hypothetical protein C8F04DRAFT_1088014 [Mycena alexandri]